MKRIALPLIAVAVLAGCSSERPAPAPVTVTVTSTFNAPAPAALGPCIDDLEVTNGTVESANTQRHVILSFKNTSSHPCTLVGYPGADLVTPAGGVLINVPRRPANAAPHLTLNPNEVATADVTAYAIDTATGDPCPRWGNLVVTPPNGFVSHPMTVDMPICAASISAVT
ncbi:hypothetical protein A5724_20600 [Mycobacterium sp. ACS1612]|uniref:DUF4232 domain-containing protein n=1 Tax=Mycobacterium sp. ACS1612 TaxID=1834117 RepID=UPI0007FE9366|nr:DUF4232 domain-containing protein [Mycobacterium sp. ACS1612]OBF33024.1 hypothetical protein A5724_20600 [Mycobacterium sp. ACS1612]